MSEQTLEGLLGEVSAEFKKISVKYSHAINGWDAHQFSDERCMDILNRFFRDLYVDKFEVELKNVKFKENTRGYSYNVPSHNSGKFIIVDMTINMKLEQNNKVTVYWRGAKDVSFYFHESFKLYDEQRAVEEVLTNKNKYIVDKVLPKLEEMFTRDVAPKLEKYKKSKKSRDKSFDKNGAALALQSIVNHISENDLKFTADEIKILLPILINNNHQLLALSSWVNKNRKLREKIDDEVMSKIMDNLIIKDVLE